MPSKAAAAALYGCLSTALLTGPMADPVCAGTFTTLYSFTNGADGAAPIGGVTSDSAGTLYGETYQGGVAGCTALTGKPAAGCGTVYSFDPVSGLRILVSFRGPNGAYGSNPLTLVGNTLFGSTFAGGASGDGVLFSVHTDGTAFKVLHEFSGIDGLHPVAALRVGKGDVIYGVAQNGGSNYPSSSNGVLFALSQDGTFTVLHAFTGGVDGAQPDALVVFANGTLVGSTYVGGTASTACPIGCGAVFSYVPSSNRFTSLFDFTTFGDAPFVGSIGSGPTVYLSAYGGVFSLTQSGGLAALPGDYLETTFQSGPLYEPGGVLFGVSANGSSGGGELFSIENNAEQSLHYFTSGKNGANPHAQPIVTKAGAIIGTTTQDGVCAACGTIWEYTP